MTDIQPTGNANPRLRQTVGSMVWSMLLVLAVVAVILLVTTRARPDAIKVGFVTPGDQYAQLGQTASANVAYIPEQTAAGRPLDTVAVGGADWQRYENSVSQRSLVRVQDGVTIVVTGTADWSLLEQFAASLRG